MVKIAKVLINKVINELIIFQNMYLKYDNPI